MTHGPAFSPQQWAVLAAFWVLVALLPAFYVRRATARDGNPAAPAWFWVVVLTGPIGFLAWRTDRRLRAKRAAQGRPMPK